MKLAHRLAFFSGGFILGILLLIFILRGKKTSCAYGPESRTLKNIRLKDRDFSEAALSFFQKNQMDTSVISGLLINGDVLFSESDTKLDSCKQYVITGKVDKRNLKVRIENCEKVATVMTATLLEN